MAAGWCHPKERACADCYMRPHAPTTPHDACAPQRPARPHLLRHSLRVCRARLCVCRALSGVVGARELAKACRVGGADLIGSLLEA